MNIYIICPVRLCDPDTYQLIKNHVVKLEGSGHSVFFPHRDAPQQDKTGYAIVRTEIKAIKSADEIHIWWDENSKGSCFDLGVALSHQKRIRVINPLPHFQHKCYGAVIKRYVKCGCHI